jgi:hypothetical protein
MTEGNSHRIQSIKVHKGEKLSAKCNILHKIETTK